MMSDDDVQNFIVVFYFIAMIMLPRDLSCHRSMFHGRGASRLQVESTGGTDEEISTYHIHHAPPIQLNFLLYLQKTVNMSMA